MGMDYILSYCFTIARTYLVSEPSTYIFVDYLAADYLDHLDYYYIIKFP